MRMMTAAGLALSAVLLTGGCQATGGDSPGKQEAQAAAAPVVTKSVTLPTPDKPGKSYTLGYAGLKSTGSSRRSPCSGRRTGSMARPRASSR